VLDKIRKLRERFEELTEELASERVSRDPTLLRTLAKEHADLEKVLKKGAEYERTRERLASNRELLEQETDPELKELAREENEELEERLETVRGELQRLLVPRDPDDDRNAILEIRSGTGGEEAALFASDLARMYQRYAEGRSWKVETLASSPSAGGGFKEIIFAVQGPGVFGSFKHERGVHRVQRVPVTESGGRIHTSAVTVAVLPEAEEVEVDIDPADLRVEVFRASGPGGQSVNTTDSAVRVTHVPTGLVVSCQDEKSQHKNKTKALKVLRARLLERAREEQEREEARQRKTQVGRGDRSEKIRTYNFPQNRVTDHRINLTLHKLDVVMGGEMEDLVEALREAELEARMAAG
jgi:peptide chain release factor 1